MCDAMLKCCHVQAYFRVPHHYKDLSNEVMYKVLSQGASKLPQVTTLLKKTFLEIFILASGHSDAPLGKSTSSSSFERSYNRSGIFKW